MTSRYTVDNGMDYYPQIHTVETLSRCKKPKVPSLYISGRLYYRISKRTSFSIYTGELVISWNTNISSDQVHIHPLSQTPTKHNHSNFLDPCPFDANNGLPYEFNIGRFVGCRANQPV